MGNKDSKRNFIIQLFLYYKPLLSKEKQVGLLLSWIDSCANMEEYEMASVLKKELLNIEGGVDEETTTKLEIIQIPETRDLSIFETKKEEKPKQRPKKRKILKFINKWDEKHGFTIVDCTITITKGHFRLVLFNYGFEFRGS